MAVTMKWPASCKVITQKYGNKSSRYVRGYHTGLDIGCVTGSPIYAAHDGRVTVAGWKGAYGNTVEIQAGSLVTSYHHMSRIGATIGKNVSAGTVIGYIGSTGQSTGPHLHFEVRINGKDVDPQPYLSGASTVDQISDGQQTGITDVFKFPGELLKAFSTLADTVMWMRIGMVILGAALLAMAFIGVAKSSAMGKAAVKTVTASVKKVGKNNAKS